MITRRKPIIDSRIERQIITGMIISTNFLTQVLDIYRPDLLLLPYAKTIAEWCKKYYGQYKQAPGKQIQDLFLTYEKGENDPDQVALIRDFLASISNEYESNQTFNIDYILDKSEIHFRKSSLEILRQQLSSDLVNDNVEEAETLIANFSRIARSETVGIDPITDPAIIKKAFDKDTGDRMFALPGDLGKMFGSFERDMLIMVVGPMGRGKTWWLQEIALRGLFIGFNVLFISLEMSEKQMTRRIQHNLTGLPKSRWAGKISIPVFDCELRQNKKCRKTDLGKYCTKCRGTEEFKPAVYHIVKRKEELTAKDGIDKGQALKKTFLRGNRFKLITPPPNSLNISKLRGMLDNWEYYEGWVPDIIVTDYADKFAPENSKTNEYRHRIYETVLMHKALAMEKHCLIVTGSQSNTGRDDSKVVRSGDFAEDIRKKAEVDIAFSLNQTPEEKDQGIMKISPMKIRDDDFSVSQQCIVLQQLKIGKPYLDSCLI